MESFDLRDFTKNLSAVSRYHNIPLVTKKKVASGIVIAAWSKFEEWREEERNSEYSNLKHQPEQHKKNKNAQQKDQPKQQRKTSKSEQEDQPDQHEKTKGLGVKSQTATLVTLECSDTFHNTEHRERFLYYMYETLVTCKKFKVRKRSHWQIAKQARSIRDKENKTFCTHFKQVKIKYRKFFARMLVFCFCKYSLHGKSTPVSESELDLVENMSENYVFDQFRSEVIAYLLIS